MTASPPFGLAHATYRAFRPAYPDALYDRILAALAGPRVLAVDLGAGTGLVSAALADRFDRVIAVEPDPAMAEHLRETAPSVTAQLVAAEQAELPEAGVDLITCANALYWMDGPAVLARVGRWLRPGGLFAAWRYPFPRLPPAIAGVFAVELAERWAPFRDPRVTETGITQRWVEAEPSLALLAAETVANPVVMTAAQMVGFAASTSFGAAYLRSLSGDRASEYLAELTAKLDAASGGEAQTLDFELRLVLARTRADAGIV